MSGSRYRFVMKDFHNQQSHYDLTGEMSIFQAAQ